MLNKSDLLAGLKSEAAALGLGLREDGSDGLAGERESIRVKWFLGGRKVCYRMSCRLTDADHKVHFREMVAETSWGIPPPTLSVERTSVKGWERSGTRTDRAVGGGGSLDYAKVRDKITELVTNAGWQFQLDGGGIP